MVFKWHFNTGPFGDQRKRVAHALQPRQVNVNLTIQWSHNTGVQILDMPALQIVIVRCKVF